MKHWWWKIAGILLVFFSLLAGLMAPLSPGVSATRPDRLQQGLNEVEIHGYNTLFHTHKNDLTIFLENGSRYVCPEKVEVKNENLLVATFDIPSEIADPFFDVFVHVPGQGLMGYDNAFYGDGLEVTTGLEEERSCVDGFVPEVATAFDFPNQPILNETIRNIFFHVPVWFAMMFIMLVSLIQSVRYLRNENPDFDLGAVQAVNVGIFFCVLGLASGSIWARFTWGAWWVSDPRLNGAAITFLIYVAYLILRGSIPEKQKAARVAAVYNIFAFAMLLLFLMVLPRMTDSLHPGVGGNPAFSQYDLDDNMRMVFYPAVLGWILVACWIYTLQLRLDKIKWKLEYEN